MLYIKEGNIKDRTIKDVELVIDAKNDPKLVLTYDTIQLNFATIQHIGEQHVLSNSIVH